MPALPARAGAGELIPVAPRPDGVATVAAGAARDRDVAKPEPVALRPADEIVLAAVVPVPEVVLVAAGPVVVERLVVTVVPVPPALAVPPGLAPLPLVAAGVVTCAAAGAASTRLSSRARRSGWGMAVTRALPLPNAPAMPRFPQRLSYSSRRRHQTPASLRPLGARSSH